MSSFNNAAKSFQKTHKERHQPEGRKHLGYLEKKKDYKERAEDYNAKKAQMQYYHKKALDKNPDEFYHHMVNSEVKEGVHFDKSKDLVLTSEQIKLMQTQDQRYISSRRVMEGKKCEKLSASLHLLDNPKPLNKHSFFVNDEQELNNFNLGKRLGTPKGVLNRFFNRPKTKDLGTMELSLIDGEKIKECNKERRKAYKELERRKEREKKLATLEKKMEIKKILQSKQRIIKERIAPETKDQAPIYLFKQQRFK